MTPIPCSLFGHDFQQVLDSAKAAAGTAQAPFPSPMDWRDLPIYFLMVDRFAGTNPIRHQPFDDPGYYDFQGGNFAAIQQQLPYIKDLGFQAIWLSPVLKNYPADNTYHGYGIYDFIHAEPRFATPGGNADNELRALIDAAHALGIYIIFDIVLNHTGEGFVYVCDSSDNLCQTNSGSLACFHPNPMNIEWRDPQGNPVAADDIIENIANPDSDALVWPKELQQNVFFRRQGQPDPNGDDTVGDFDSLRQMMTDNLELESYLIRAYQYVIARFDVDAFRIDTLRYLKGGLPCTFGNATREFALSIGKKNFFTFGEVDDGNAENDIAKFIGRNTSNSQGDMVGVDAALDYPLYFALKPVIKGLAPTSNVVGMYQYRKSVENDILSSHGDATRFFVTFLDNHDVQDRIRYWQPGSQPQIDSQVVAGLACLFSLQGIPCLYYGTEQGLHGRGSDPAVREALWCGPGFGRTNPFYQEIKNINAMRAKSPALRYGRQYFRPISGNMVNFAVSTSFPSVIAFSRILNDEEVVVVYNSYNGPLPPLYIIIDATLNPVDSAFRLLYSNNPNPQASQPVQVAANNVIVAEVDGSTGFGPVTVLALQLGATEVQVLSR
jgi:glycosidase